MRKLMLVAVFMAFGVSTMSMATAAEMSGVTMPDTVEVGGQELALNGMGMRKKAWFEVYVGTLYLPEKTDKAADAIEVSGPSRMVMQFMRDVPADKIIDGWNDGFANNNGEELRDAIADRIATFNEFFSEDLKKGDIVVMDYVPEEGVHVSINDEEKGTIEGQDFATALRAVWLGPKPPSKNFREGLLGDD